MTEMRHGTSNGRPIGELVRDLSQQTSTLVRKEVELARAELTEKGRHMGAGAGMFGAAGLLAMFASAAITAGLVALVATAVAVWLAAFIVAAAYVAIAGLLALTGREQVRRATPPIPEQATESMKEDLAWTKNRAKAARQ